MKGNTKANKIINYLPIVFFFTPYFGLIPIAYGTILLMIIINIRGDLKVGFYDFLLLIALLILSVLKYKQVGFLVADSLFRYYFGIVILYWFFKIHNVKVDVQQLLFFFCAAVFIEAVVINLFFDPFRYLPNYPISVFENNLTGHYTKFMGFYQRPYSVGMNASCSSAILCGLLMCRWEMIKIGKIIGDKRLEILGGATVFLFASGVGLGLYFFYLLHRFRLITIRRFLILVIVCSLLIVNYDIIFSLFSSDSIFQKVSAAYIGFLYEFKLLQIEDVVEILKSGNNSIIIGQAFENKSAVIIQSDFAWNDFFQCLGLMGLFIFFTFLINKFNRYTLFPIVLFLAGAIHYGGMFTLSGQIVLAIILIEFTNNGKYLKLPTSIVPPKDKNSQF